MPKYVCLIILCCALFILPVDATVRGIEAMYDCDTVAGDPNQGIILEWDTLPGTKPYAVGIPYVELKYGDTMTFTVTQVSGGPTPVDFRPPFSAIYEHSIAPTTFTYVAQADKIYDTFEVKVGDYSTGSVKVNWECGKAKPDGHIHDGRINSGDLGTLTVVYPQETQIDVYAVNPETSEGYMVIRFPLDQLPPYSTPPTEPLLLGEATSPFTGKTIALYLLPSNEFVIAAENPDGTPYRFLWTRTE